MTWRGVNVEIMCRFAEACGVNLLASSRVYQQIRRYKLMHLSKGCGANRRAMFVRLFKSLNELNAEKKTVDGETPQMAG